jgi:hypothetical protein
MMEKEQSFSWDTIMNHEEQKRMERMAKQRLQALKANDEEAYLKLLGQAKNTRITHLLKQRATLILGVETAQASILKESHACAISGAQDQYGKINLLQPPSLTTAN